MKITEIRYSDTGAGWMDIFTDEDEFLYAVKYECPDMDGRAALERIQSGEVVVHINDIDGPHIFREWFPGDEEIMQEALTLLSWDASPRLLAFAHANGIPVPDISSWTAL